MKMKTMLMAALAAVAVSSASAVDLLKFSKETETLGFGSYRISAIEVIDSNQSSTTDVKIVKSATVKSPVSVKGPKANSGTAHAYAIWTSEGGGIGVPKGVSLYHYNNVVGEDPKFRNNNFDFETKTIDDVDYYCLYEFEYVYNPNPEFVGQEWEKVYISTNMAPVVFGQTRIFDDDGVGGLVYWRDPIGLVSGGTNVVDRYISVKTYIDRYVDVPVKKEISIGTVYCTNGYGKVELDSQSIVSEGDSLNVSGYDASTASKEIRVFYER